MNNHTGWNSSGTRLYFTALGHRLCASCCHSTPVQLTASGHDACYEVAPPAGSGCTAGAIGWQPRSQSCSVWLTVSRTEFMPFWPLLAHIVDQKGVQCLPFQAHAADVPSRHIVARYRPHVCRAEHQKKCSASPARFARAWQCCRALVPDLSLSERSDGPKPHASSWEPHAAPRLPPQAAAELLPAAWLLR